jgi:hypothetical protein
VAQGTSPQHEVEGARIRLWLVKRTPAFDQGNAGGQGAGDPTRDGVLKVKNIRKLAIEPIAPDYSATA